MVPAEPAQLRASGADTRVGVEIVTVNQRRHMVRFGEGQSSDKVFWLRVLIIMMFANTEQAMMSGVDTEVGKSIAPVSRGNRLRFAVGLAGIQSVNLLIVPVNKIDDVVINRIAGTTIFVDAAGSAVGSGQYVPWIAIVVPLHNDIATTFVGTTFQPVEICAISSFIVDDRLIYRRCCTGDQLS